MIMDNATKSRVIDERDALVAKVAALTDFVYGPRSVDLYTDDFALLARQREIMQDYLKILNERIGRFTVAVTTLTA